MEPITPRQCFEVIVDTCSMGEKKMRGVSAMIKHTMAKQPRVFQDYRIVVPLQLGTEARQRMFPEFLEKEFALHSKRQRGLDAFVARHEGHVHVAETESSLAFKFLYSQKAAQLLQIDPSLRPQVLEQANALAKRYAEPGTKPQPIGKKRLNRLMGEILVLAKEYRPRVQESQEKLRGYFEKQAGDGSLPPLHREMSGVQRKALARAATRFFDQCAPEDKLLLQAMYSSKPLNTRVCTDRQFVNFRTDLGERAIEDYLYSKRSKTNAQNVSLVVSEDRGARRSIQLLRGRSENTIFVVGSYGLALALKQLSLIDSLYDVMEPELMGQIKVRKSWAEEKKSAGTIIGMNDINEPEIERKWARRLVEVLETGYFSRQPKRERPSPGADTGIT